MLSMIPASPLTLSIVGDRYAFPCRIIAIVWEGSSTSGDTCLISQINDNSKIWRGRTDVTQTYLGVSFAAPGVHSPSGFILSQISSGIVSVYIGH